MKYFCFLFINKKRLAITNLRHFSSKIKSKERPSIREEEILIFSHKHAQKYYKINVPFLFGYLFIELYLLQNSDYPKTFKNTVATIASLCAISIIGVYFYSRRHIRSLTLKRPSNILNVETFAKFGFGSKQYQMNLNNIKELVPISNYIYFKKTGIYLLKPTSDKKYFKYFNFFFIRPTKGNVEFDNIFMKKIKRS